MDILGMLKTIGTGLLRNALPPLSVVAFDLINKALPDDKKLSETSTGADAEKAILSLPPLERASLLEKKLDVEMTEIKEWSKVISALAEVDKTGNSTRPEIAREMSKIIGFSVIATLTPLAYAITTGDSKMVDSINSAWPLILAIIGVPSGVVSSYFGKRTQEKAQKYQSLGGAAPAGGMISQIIGMFKKV